MTGRSWTITLEPMPLLPLIAVIIAAFALAIAAVALVANRRLAGELARIEAQSRDTAEQFRGLTAGTVGQSRNLARLQQDLERLRERLDQVASQEGGGAAFEQAIRMARKGHPAGEIMETCGLSQMEADLVVLLHQESRAEG
ncbi:DUF2802 domain-containing protein [Sediminicurvatus halobius]|uniref:DUF2802 domain-containing protein n=1 Tax=Sediminicurvatus halobius TaxID=2182432 RepID=A0A2U2N374_9GAMM|nr:DUF2802 domain-containing protein [Spiribacter halobius]PWG63671.1 hypothetical protein DEM34_07270 [Spiribacter halobius]UEX79810.1 DUF2802 domain-containing protein [Spiribacter halobius]